jgi:hypothetical protein
MRTKGYNFSILPLRRGKEEFKEDFRFFPSPSPAVDMYKEHARLSFPHGVGESRVITEFRG